MEENFKAIKGNAQLIKILRNAVINKSSAPAYVFSGPRGIGKRLAAKSFAKALLCVGSDNGDSCGSCKSCRTADSGNNPDIIHIRSDKVKGIGVKEAREQIVTEMETNPYLYKYKIFIIEDALTLETQNALLKTLEEGAEYGRFIILTEQTGSLLPTVLSRAVTLKLSPVDTDIVAGELISRLNTEPERARFIAELSCGNIGQALVIAQDESFAKMRDEITGIIFDIKNKSTAEILLSAKEFDKYKDNIHDALEIIVLYFKDIAAYIESGIEYITQKDIIDKIKKGAAIYNAEEALSGAEAAFSAAGKLLRNGNFGLIIEIMLLETAGKILTD